MSEPPAIPPPKTSKTRLPIFLPFRKALLRGLGVLAPPLLTSLILVWVAFSVNQYVLQPVTDLAREALVFELADVRRDLHVTNSIDHTATDGKKVYRQIDGGAFIPWDVYSDVQEHLNGRPAPPTAEDYYRRYVDLNYLRPWIVLPVFLCAFILLLYFLGKFLAAGLGRAVWGRMERTINRLPLIRSVYSAVKQFTDFFLSEKEIQFTRVVAVEYPRRGMWIVAFAVSEGMADVAAAANEPIVCVFIPTSPMPMTGYALMVPRREVIDLNISLDQAIQFIVSCGVVAPAYVFMDAQQRQQLVAGSAEETPTNNAGAPCATAASSEAAEEK